MSYCNGLFSLLDQLQAAGVKHIEFAWAPHPGWMKLVERIQNNFQSFHIGAASITSLTALTDVSKLGLSYAMTPFWDPSLQQQSKNLKQLLIPGVLSPTEIQAAYQFGCRIIKLFPASTMGINYLTQLKGPINSLPFIIASGGLDVTDLDPWLKAGYGAVALGRGLIRNGIVDPALKKWIDARRIKSYTID